MEWERVGLMTKAAVPVLAGGAVFLFCFKLDSWKHETNLLSSTNCKIESQKIDMSG